MELAWFSGHMEVMDVSVEVRNRSGVVWTRTPHRKGFHESSVAATPDARAQDSTLLGSVTIVPPVGSTRWPAPGRRRQLPLVPRPLSQAPWTVFAESDFGPV
jgi:hypothetical protein